MFIKRFHIREHELGLLFKDGEFRRLLEPGRHWFLRVRAMISACVGGGQGVAMILERK